RFSYSAIGDAVNVASRVEGLTKQCKVSILVADTTRASAGDLAFLEADLVRVVGRSEPIALFALIGDDAHALSAGFVDLRAAHAGFLTAYRSLDLGLAETLLARLRQMAPPAITGLYEVYADRLEEMRASPPPPGWDGVFVAKQK
ncbi:MAG: adenylate/guanylate cyclase domain-containing protein, partial [Devosia sp.]